MANIVRLLEIKTTSVKREFNNEMEVSTIPTFGFDIDVSHKSNNSNIVHIHLAYTISNMADAPLFVLRTKSVFDVTEEKRAFYSPVKDGLVDLLANLVVVAYHHLLGIYSREIIDTPLADLNMYSLPSPIGYYEIISEILQERNN